MNKNDTDITNTVEASETPSKPRFPRIFRRMVPRKRWADMSPAQRTGNVLMAVVETALVVLALLDLRRRPANEIRGSKRMWAMTAFIQPFGPVIYFIFGRKKPTLSADAGQLLPA